MAAASCRMRTPFYMGRVTCRLEGILRSKRWRYIRLSGALHGVWLWDPIHKCGILIESTCSV